MNLRATFVWYLSRAFLFVDYLLEVAQRGLAWIQHELLWRISSERTRFIVNQRLYQSEKEYLPDQDFFRAKLFDWEQSVRSHPHFPKSGRILLLAAGAGREANAFLQHGYEVTCLEPNPRFFSAAVTYFRSSPSMAWLPYSFSDLIQCLDNPSASNPCPQSLRKPFDAVWIGWGAFSYLHREEDQKKLLTLLRCHSPDACLVLSYLLQPAAPGIGGKLRELISGASIGPSKVFYRRSGFTYLFSSSRLNQMFRECGFDIALMQTTPYPHAFLRPMHKDSHG